MPRHAGTSRLFVDHAIIQVRSGRGGHGCVSFRREKYVPKGGPDGGDGGRGGSVWLEARSELSTLLDLVGHHHWRAENGRPGEGANKTGRNGADLTVPVPVGTLIYDNETGRLLKDLVTNQQRVCVAKGGRGGYGNLHYVSATHQTPRESTPGQPGRERALRLELKLIADAGFVGLPNAGKSTLLSRLTRARPKIADYPFTTLDPQLGLLELPGFRRLVLADIPGLIEGAHEGVGLGDAFLRHVERTRVLVHLIDLCPGEGAPTPTEAYHVIRGELESYSPTLAARDEIIVGNKLDLTESTAAREQLEQSLGRKVLGISAVTGAGLRELGEALWRAVEAARAAEPLEVPSAQRIDLGDIFSEDATDVAPDAADSAAAPNSDDDVDATDARPDDAAGGDETEPGRSTR